MPAPDPDARIRRATAHPASRPSGDDAVHAAVVEENARGGGNLSRRFVWSDARHPPRAPGRRRLRAHRRHPRRPGRPWHPRRRRRGARRLHPRHPDVPSKGRRGGRRSRGSRFTVAPFPPLLRVHVFLPALSPQPTHRHRCEQASQGAHRDRKNAGCAEIPRASGASHPPRREDYLRPRRTTPFSPTTHRSRLDWPLIPQRVAETFVSTYPQVAPFQCSVCVPTTYTSPGPLPHTP